MCLLVVLIVLPPARGVDVLLAKQDAPFHRTRLLQLSESAQVITSVVPGDFDGDVQMDLLLTLRQLGAERDDFTLVVYWGNQGKVSGQCYTGCVLGKPG